MCGQSNVVYWLQERGFEPTDELVAAVFAAAKASDRTLTEAEVLAVCDREGAEPAG